MKQTSIATLATTAALLIASSGEARAERFQAGMRGGAHFVPMDSMDALSEEAAYAAFSLVAGIALPELSPVPGFETELALSWDMGTLDGTSFGRIHSRLDLDTLVASARLRRTLIPDAVSAFAQLGMGAQWADLALQDAESSSARAVRGKNIALLSSAGAGLDVSITSGKTDFDLRVRLELAYELASSLDFDAEPESPGDDALPLSTMSAPLGSVNTTGLFLGLGVVGAL